MKSIKLLFITTLLTLTCSIVHAKSSNYSDAVVTNKLHKLYKKDDLINPSDIIIHNKKGLIKLEGLVNSYTEYEKALVLAHSVKGVKNVNADNLHVRKSEQLLKDTLITAKIKGAAIQSKLITYHDIRLQTINIETNNGHVYMSGVVMNQEQKENLIKIAIQIHGVKDVDATSIRVSKQA